MTPVKTKVFLQIICSLLIFLFVYTAINKLFAPEQFETTLYRSPIPDTIVKAISRGLPVTELLTAVLLLVPRTQAIGLSFSFILMSVFTLYVGYMMLFVPHLPCSCGGIISRLSWRQHLVVNIFFMLLAFSGIALTKQSKIFIRINRKSRTPA